MPITDEFAEVQRVLTKLPMVIQEKVVVGATRAAAKVVADEAKRRVPVDSGLLKKSIGVAKAKKKDTPKDSVRFYIVPKTKVSITQSQIIRGKKHKIRVKGKSFHGHFVEFGTKKMKAKPYLWPAAEASKTKAVKAFQDYAILRTEKEVRKLAK